MLLYIILSDSSSDYKYRLISLHVLLLMMLFELKNIIFFIKSLTSRSDLFNILDHALFASGHTKSTKFAKLGHQASKTDFVRHFYFRHLPHLWSAPPPISISTHHFHSVKKILLVVLSNLFRL